MDKSVEEESEERVKRLEDHFKSVFSPMEPTIMRLQSLLVWENPVKSAVMIVCIHGIFWFLTYGNCRFYSTVCTALIVVYFLHTWKKKIWPEIRVPPKSPDSDDWTPVHPKLLSVPELCRHLALFWCYIGRCVLWWTSLRKNRPFKFFIESTFIFMCGAIVGHYISGVMLSYMIIMSMVLWPCLQYHSLLKKLYMKFEPIFMKLDYSIKVKNKWRYKDRAAVSTNENTTDMEGKRATSMCADNESDLEDFYPTDPTISAALARAITDSEDEGGTLGSTSITPGLSKEPSIVNSDDGRKEDEIENDFALSLDVMPSFEDTLDHTDDELLMPSRESSEEAIRFIPSHFDESNGKDDSVPQGRLSKWSAEGGMDSSEKVTQAIAEQLVSQTFTTVMKSTIQNSLLGALSNMTGGGEDPRLVQSPGDRVASTHTDSDDEHFEGDSLDGDDEDYDDDSLGHDRPGARNRNTNRRLSVDSDDDSLRHDHPEARNRNTNRRLSVDSDDDSLDHGHAGAQLGRKLSVDSDEDSLSNEQVETRKERKLSQDSLSGSLNIEDFDFLDEYDVDGRTEKEKQ